MNSRAFILNWLIMALAMIGVVIAAVILESELTHQQNQKKAFEIQSRLSEVSARIESVIHSNVIGVRGLSAYLSINENLPDEEFESVASLFLSNNPLINNIGLVDQSYNVIRVFPEPDNQAALGANLLNSPEHAISAKEAMRTGLVRFGGPVELFQGGQAFLVRMPVFDPDDGYVRQLLSFPIRLNRLYRSVGLTSLMDEYVVAIRKMDDYSPGSVFFGQPDLFQGEYVSHELNLPGAKWQIGAVPYDRFQSPLENREWIYVVAVFLLLVIAAIQWLRIRELRSLNLIEKQQLMLDQAQKVGRMGNWSWHIPSDEKFWSEEAYRLFGLDTESTELIEKGYLAFVHKDDIGMVQLASRQAMKDGGRYQIDFRIVRADGELRWIHSEGVVELNSTKKPLRVFGTFQDVTSGKRIERKLKQRESQLRAVTDAAQSLIMIVRCSDGVVRFSNPSCQRLLGITPEALNGCSLRELCRNPQDFDELLEPVNKGRGISGVNLTLIRVDDRSQVTFLLGGQGIVYEGENCFVADLVDISSMLQAQSALEDSEERFRLFAENAPGAFWLADTEWNTIDFLSKGFERITGCSAQDVMSGKTGFFDCIHAEDKERVRDVFRRASGKAEIIEYRVIRPDGELHWVRSISFATFDAKGRLRNIGGIAEDITDSHLSNQRLKLAASVYENTAEAIVITDNNNQIVSVNDAFGQITGYSLEEVQGKNPSVLSSGKQDKSFYSDMWASLSHYGRWKGEVWNRRKGGELYAEWLSITALRNEEGAIENYVAVFTDITDRKEKEELIRYQANFDALTGIPNRVLFHDRLEQAIANVGRHGGQGALMFIDLDRFKEVNDTLGHEAGDDLLKEVASRLSGLVRESDTVARLGGDEFTVMLPDFELLDGVNRVVEKVIECLSREYQLEDNKAHISASIGITVFPDDGTDVKSILQNADQAMYAAKSAGRQTFRYFTSEMQAAVLEKQLLQQDMRRAIEKKEFSLFYQPIVDSEQQVVKLEALIRWIHPDKGFLSPDKFIPLAEESGQILPLGLWVFEEAVRQLSIWSDDKPDLSMAINLSSRQISTDERHTEYFASILEKYNVPAERVTLEVTESLFLDPAGEAVQKLEALRDYGFRIAIDDFGTGYSSLSYLKQLPLSIIKIDKAFVGGLDKESGDHVLVDAIISIANSMSLDVIAEGVETEEQAEYLKRQGAQMQQGWLYSKPLAVVDAAGFLQNV